MPLYHFTCPACQVGVRKVVPVSEAERVRCPACGGALKRVPKPPTCTVTETLDNGFMTKRLERPADAERLYKERGALDPSREK